MDQNQDQNQPSENLKTPEFIRTRLDVKGETLRAIITAIEVYKSGVIEGSVIDPATKVSLVTNLGLITGDIEGLPTNNSEINKDNVTSLTEVLFLLRNQFLSQLEAQIGSEQVQAVNNSQIITVKNATIRTFASPPTKFEAPVLCVFADQIVGFTFGV